MTNSQKIRAMTDEQLAALLFKTRNPCPWWCGASYDCDGDDCESGLLDWLKQEVSDNG